MTLKRRVYKIYLLIAEFGKKNYLKEITPILTFIFVRISILNENIPN